MELDILKTKTTWNDAAGSINNNFEKLRLAVGNETFADKTFVHTQLSASKEWLVNHNLGKFPSVTVVDSAQTVVIGEVTYIDSNNLKITFSAEFGGTAYLN